MTALCDSQSVICGLSTADPYEQDRHYDGTDAARSGLDPALWMSRQLLSVPDQASYDGRIVEDTVVAAPAARVYDALQDVTRWPRLLPNVRGVRLTYDDGRHQEFSLELAGNDGGATSVRSVRRCGSNHIACFHPDPAWPLKHYCEDWLIRPLTRSATHLTVVLRWNHATAAHDARPVLRARTKAELATWQRSLQGG